MKILKVYQDKDTHDLIFVFDEGPKWVMPWQDADHPDTPEEDMEWDGGFDFKIPTYHEDFVKQAIELVRYSHIWNYMKERIPNFTLDIEPDGTHIYYEVQLTFQEVKLLISES